MTSTFDNIRFDIVKWGKSPTTLGQVLIADPAALGLTGHLYENTLGKEPQGINVSDWDRTSKFSLFSRQIANTDAALKDGRIVRVTHERNPETRGWDLLATPLLFTIAASKRSLGTTRDRTLALNEYTNA